jgi:hypothetical protein
MTLTTTGRGRRSVRLLGEVDAWRPDELGDHDRSVPLMMNVPFGVIDRKSPDEHRLALIRQWSGW